MSDARVQWSLTQGFPRASLSIDHNVSAIQYRSQALCSVLDIRSALYRPRIQPLTFCCTGVGMEMP